jgi:hypothetical protein
MEREHGLGRWTVRLVALLGVALMSLGASGWWLSTRVLDSNGFADVVATASQRKEVRDYIADEATLRLARTSNFVSAARPVVTEALSAAINTQPVKDAVYDFAQRVHEQVFRATSARRVAVDSSEAATTVRTALQAINPRIAKKLPPNLISATTTISQSGTVDTLFRASAWVKALYFPLFILGVLLLVVVAFRARDRVHAIRVIGILMALGGALALGLGFATPAFAAAAETNVPGRGDAVAAFIGVLVGRIVGAGQAFLVVGLLLALAPGHDGGDLRDRADRVRAWFAAKRLKTGWRVAGGLGLMLAALLALTQAADLFRALLVLAALLVLYIGIVVTLRATGLLVTDHTIKRLHARQVVGVFAALVLVAVATASVAVGIVARNTDDVRANPTNQGCNGYIELCTQSIDTIVWPASHNAMSSSAYNFFGAEHTTTVGEQLNSGIRWLMLDAYYGYDDRGLVRTNLAGGVDKKELRDQSGSDAVDELDRLGALTGAADTSGKKQDVYFCHNYCELGAVKATEMLGEVRDFMDRNLTDVVVLDFEDYIRPKDLKKALVDAGLLDRVYRPTSTTEWPSLYDMVVPKNPKAYEAKRRLIVMSEKNPDNPYPWLIGTYNVSEETPFDFRDAKSFNCKAARGKTGKSFFIVNHWVRPQGAPDPVEAADINSEKTLTKRVQQCIEQRQKLPNAIAVDFTNSGDLFKTVNRLNAAVARVTGVSGAISDAIRDARATGTLSAADRENIRALHRLPTISEAKARALLGPLADSLPPPPSLSDIVKPPKNENEDENAGEPSTTTTEAPPVTSEP